MVFIVLRSNIPIQSSATPTAINTTVGIGSTDPSQKNGSAERPTLNIGFEPIEMNSEIESRYDEQYQRNYYFNRRTSATGWSIEDVQQKQPQSQAAGHSRGSVYEGQSRGSVYQTPARTSTIKVLYDKSTGQEYFYNEETGQTGWTAEEVSYLGVAPATPAGQYVRTPSAHTENSHQSPSVATNVSVGEEIEERWAESKGQYYFVHKSSGKTAWSREELLQDLASGQQMPKAPLSADVKSKKSSDGRIYYYNVVTGKSGWRPEDVIEPAATEDVREHADVSAHLSTREETEYAMKQAESEMQIAMDKARESAEMARLRADKEMERAMKLAEHNAELARKRAEERSLMELRRAEAEDLAKRQQTEDEAKNRTKQARAAAETVRRKAEMVLKEREDAETTAIAERKKAEEVLAATRAKVHRDNLAAQERAEEIINRAAQSYGLDKGMARTASGPVSDAVAVAVAEAPVPPAAVAETGAADAAAASEPTEKETEKETETEKNGAEDGPPDRQKKEGRVEEVASAGGKEEEEDGENKSGEGGEDEDEDVSKAGAGAETDSASAASEKRPGADATDVTSDATTATQAGEQEADDEEAMEKRNRAAELICAFFQGVMLRAQGLEYARSFDKNQPFGLVIHHCRVDEVVEGGQAEKLDIKPGSYILRVNGVKAKNDTDLGLVVSQANEQADFLIIAQAKVKKGEELVLTFAAPGTRRGTKAENRAAEKITAFLRGILHRSLGIEYEREFGDGAFKMEIRECVVNKVHPGGEGEKAGVLPGSRVLRVNDEKIYSDMELGMAIKAASRPLKITFSMPDMWKHKSGRLQKLSGTVKKGKKWKEKVVEVNDIELLAKSTKQDYVDKLQLKRCSVEALEKSFLKKHKKKFAFIVKQGEGEKDQMVFACEDQAEFDSWFEFMERRCKKQ